MQARIERYRPMLERFIDVLNKTLPHMDGGFRFPQKDSNNYSYARSDLRYEFPFDYKKQYNLIKLLEDFPTLREVQQEVVSQGMSQGERYVHFVRPWEDILKDLSTYLSEQMSHEDNIKRQGRDSAKNKPDSLALETIRALRAISNRIAHSHHLLQYDADTYNDLRGRLYDLDQALLPPSIQKHRNAESFFYSIRNDTISGSSITDEFDELLMKLTKGDEESDQPKASSEWTGRRTVIEQVRIIKQMIPLAMDALDLLIVEHQLRLHNQPEASEQGPLFDLRCLHAELGNLLSLADRGHSISTALKRVERAANRALSIVAESRDILISGTPAFGVSAGLSFAIIMALRAVYGEIGPVEAATIIGGTTAGVVPLAKRKGKSKTRR